MEQTEQNSYFVIKVNFYKLPESAAVIVTDGFRISEGLEEGVC